MREAPYLFGPDRNLLGVISHADATPRRVGCLLFNAGVLHHIGPHRINVKLARALASSGLPTLRMDLSGLGDSVPPRQTAAREEQVLQDLQAGVDLLGSQCGATEVIVIGICSGAVQGHALAMADARVRGLLMFDGFVYRTILTRAISYWRRLGVTPWRAVLPKVAEIMGRAIRKLRRRQDGQPGPPPEGSAGLSREEFGASLATLTARGVAVRIVYSGSFLELYNHPSQFRRTYPRASFLDRVVCDYMPQVDHTFTTLDSQRRFIDSTVAWVRTITQDAAAEGADRPSARRIR